MFVRTSMDSEGQDATKITSALKDSRIYSFTKMMTLHMCIVEVTIFSQCLTFLSSQCCGNVDVKTRWSLQNQSFDEKFCWTSWALWKLLLWVSGFFQTQCWSGMKRGSGEARKIQRGTRSLRFQSRYHESRQVFPKDDSQGWRFTLLIFQSHKWHFCWNILDVRKRAYWRWWWKTLDEDRWYASSIARTSF